MTLAVRLVTGFNKLNVPFCSLSASAIFQYEGMDGDGSFSLNLTNFICR
jgi:hypothetical protein